MFLAFFAAQPSLAHELWIDGKNFQGQSDETIRLDLRNGQNFKGSAQAYFKARVKQHEAIVSLILVLISDKTVVLIMFYLGHFSLDGTKQSGTSSCFSISSLERVQSFID